KRAEAAARVQAHPADGPEDRNLWERCLTRGVPMVPGPYNNDFQIVQSAGFVAIYNEMIHEARIVPLDGRPHPAPAVQGRIGDPRGRWEGDTLVVESANFSEKNNLRPGSDPLAVSSTQLKLTERFTRTGPDTVLYQFRVEDPATFTRPWAAEMQMTSLD